MLCLEIVTALKCPKQSGWNKKNHDMNWVGHVIDFKNKDNKKLTDFSDLQFPISQKWSFSWLIGHSGSI